jgi:hypothetical protein
VAYPDWCGLVLFVTRDRAFHVFPPNDVRVILQFFTRYVAPNLTLDMQRFHSAFMWIFEKAVSEGESLTWQRLV